MFHATASPPVSPMKKSETKQSLRVLTLGVAISVVLSMFFFWVWYERYLSIEFNELGRYYDAETQTVHTDSAFVWCLPAFGFLLLAIVKVSYRLWSRWARKGANATARELGR